MDKSIDRKMRIAALKESGFSVFPALQLAEARTRCRPGAYGLIIVNAQDEPQAAVSFCDELSARTPAQAVLLAVSNGSTNPERAYVVQDDPKALVQRAEALLGRSHKSEEAGEREDLEDTSERVSA